MKTAPAITRKPRGFNPTALPKSPCKILPIDLVVPQNGQGSPVKLRNRQRIGPSLKPEV